MPLLPTDKDPQPDFVDGGFRVPMLDGEKRVAVVASAGFLDDLAHDVNRLSTFTRYRVDIEKAASAKYDRGDVRENGDVVLMWTDRLL